MREFGRSGWAVANSIFTRFSLRRSSLLPFPRLANEVLAGDVEISPFGALRVLSESAASFSPPCEGGVSGGLSKNWSSAPSLFPPVLFPPFPPLAKGGLGGVSGRPSDIVVSRCVRSTFRAAGAVALPVVVGFRQTPP